MKQEIQGMIDGKEREPKERQFYTVEEVHEITGLSKPTIYRAIQEKKLPSLREAGAIRIPKWWIDQLLSPQPLGAVAQ